MKSSYLRFRGGVRNWRRGPVGLFLIWNLLTGLNRNLASRPYFCFRNWELSNCYESFLIWEHRDRGDWQSSARRPWCEHCQRDIGEANIGKFYVKVSLGYRKVSIIFLLKNDFWTLQNLVHPKEKRMKFFFKGRGGGLPSMVYFYFDKGV